MTQKKPTSTLLAANTGGLIIGEWIKEYIVHANVDIEKKEGGGGEKKIYWKPARPSISLHWNS